MNRYAKKSLKHQLVVAGILAVLYVIALPLDNPKGIMSALNWLLMMEIIVAIMLAVSLNLILGMTGQFSLGHAGFAAVGAYTVIAVAGKPEFFVPQLAFWHGSIGLSVSTAFTLISLTAMIAAVLVCAVLGLLVGLPTLRLRGDYLAIATLGFGEIVATVIRNTDYLNGALGAHLKSELRTWVTNQADLESPSPLTGAVRTYLSNNPYMISSFAAFACLLVTVLVVRNIKYSTSGRALMAVREDVIAAESAGVPTVRYKIASFVIGAALAGLGGALLAHYNSIGPDVFRFMFSVTIVLFVVLGGQGSITGSALAAALLTTLPVAIQRNTVLDSGVTEKWRMVVYALLIIVAMLFMPRGLFGRMEISDLYRKFFPRRKPLADDDEDTHVPAPGAKVSPTDGQPLLVAHKMTMQFGGLRAVDSFSLAMKQGELVGLIGPNGAGKTTVFNVLTGVYRATAGDIRVRGESITHYRPHTICSKGVARTFQNIRLFQNLTVLDNVQIAQHMHHQEGIPSAILRTPAFFREEAQSRRNAMELLELFKLDHLAGESAASLSYGDQRRLEIARALATRPCLLLLDEPAAGMNPTEKRELMDLIREVRSRFGLAILIIEHDMKVIMGVCERIVVLDYGKTIAQGTPEEIRRHPAVIEAYLGASAK